MVPGLRRRCRRPDPLNSSRSFVIEIRTFGAVSVRAAGAETLVQPKRLLLLIYLLLEARDTSVRRDSVLALFWPEADAEHARNALRQAVFGLRTVLGEDLVLSRAGELGVDYTMIRCDALDLLDAADRQDHAAVDAAYRGEFLPGLHAGQSAELSRWLDDMQLRFRRMAAMAVRARLADASLDAEQRLALLERLLMLQPYDEASAMLHVQTLFAAGRRSAAVEAYRRFASRLQADLELSPSPAFVELVESGRQVSTVPTVAAMPSATASERPPVHSAEPRPRASTSARVRRGAVAGGVLLAAGLAVIGVAAVQPATDPARVVVQPFVGRDASDAERRLAARAEAVVRTEVAALPGFVVVAAGGRDSPWQLLRGVRRAGTLVTGGVERTSDGQWRLWANVVAEESGLLVERSEVGGAGADSLAARLARRVAVTVATRREMALRWGETLHRPESLAAWNEYQQAFEAVLDGDAAGGIARFRRAWTLDSTFHFAALMAANNADAIGERAVADTILAALEPRASGFLPLERAQYRRIRAWMRNDLPSVLAESREIVRLEPRAPFLLSQYAQDAFNANRPREALRALDRLPANPRSGLAGELGVRAVALHLLGRYAQELAAVDAALASESALPHVALLRLPALAALGRADSLTVMLAALAARGELRDVARLYRSAGLELEAHGHAADGARLLDLGLAWMREQPDFPGATTARRLSNAELAIDAADLPLALQILSAVDTGALRSAGARSAYFALRGQLAARLGSDTERQRWADSLRLLRAPGRYGTETYRRARIAAAADRRAEALALLEQARQEGFIANREMHVDPAFRSLRTDRRFRRLAAPAD